MTFHTLTVRAGTATNLRKGLELVIQEIYVEGEVETVKVNTGWDYKNKKRGGAGFGWLEKWLVPHGRTWSICSFTFYIVISWQCSYVLV